MATQTHAFQAEVAKVLDIVVHSLYSNKEIFLRELISNASDACDKLRFAALTDASLGGADQRIVLEINKDAGTLSVSDNGIGMNQDDLTNHLGTIAKSGTAEFIAALSGDAKKDSGLIGQFGVGFYSVLMVADEVVVTTRKAGESQGWRWVSAGAGTFTIEEAEVAETGTRIELKLKEDEKEFLDSWRLKSIVSRYSDHIAVPVVLKEGEGDGETINAAQALWTRSKSDITPEQYTEFYHHVAHAFDEPWSTLHYKAEGAIEYTALLFVPGSKPFDLFQAERKSALKLYVKRVFITDQSDELLPPYLRFVKGVVDASDIPLNVSREMLQHNPVLAKMKTGLTKKVLAELKKKSEDADSYNVFWEIFGPVLKEGIYEDFERKSDILELARFKTSNADGWVSLKDVAGRLKEGQDVIYYATGASVEGLKKSPQLEGFAAKGVEVLLLTDPVDEFWLNNVPEYDGKKLVPVTDASIDLSAIKSEAVDQPEAADAGDMDVLIAALKLALGDKVKDVKTSDRLTNSAVCLVSEKGQMSMHLERMLKAHGQLNDQAARILEINPRHDLVKSLSEIAKNKGQDAVADGAWLLLDQARILEGEPPLDPQAFAARMAAVMTRGL